MSKWTLRNPIAVDDLVTTALGTAVVINPLANDSDPNGDRLTLIAIDGYGTRYRDWVRVDNGWVNENTKGTLTYYPDDGFVGTETFTYTISDRGFWYLGKKSTATITIEVTGNVNQAPVAAADAVSVNENSQVLIDVLANDSDTDGDTLTVTSVGAAAFGAVTKNANGTLTYTPDTGFSGIDSFTYSISDGFDGQDTATVTVTVNAANTAPLAASDTVTVNENTAITIDVLANDFDADDHALSITNIGSATYGTVTQNIDGTLTYTPDMGFSGIDSFDYTISDGHGGLDTATVTVTVDGVNDAPSAADDMASTSMDTAVVINVLANDTDADNDLLSISNTGLPAHGAVRNNHDGTLTYTPDSGYEGADTFTYTIHDGHGGYDSAQCDGKRLYHNTHQPA